MINAGIFPGDILIVDRSLEAVDKKIVIAVINGELTVKRLRIRSGQPFLEPENDQYSPSKLLRTWPSRSGGGDQCDPQGMMKKRHAGICPGGLQQFLCVV